MLAAIVRVEGLLLRKGLVCDDTLPAMRQLCRLGFQVFAASDRETILQDDLEAMGATPVCEASLGAKPFTYKGLDAIVNQVGFPNGRIYAISSVFRDIAAAALGGLPTILVGTTAEGPRAVATLQEAVDRLREPYASCAMELRAMFIRSQKR